MASVFISYRRDDSAGEAGRLADALEARFGKERVFRDVEDIPAGEDFARAIDRALAKADTLLVVIGREWLEVRNAAGQRRLEDAQDFVRLEVESALAHELRVLPVLVRGTPMPAADELPESLRPLARIQAHELSDSRWDYDVRQLVGLLEQGRGWQTALRKHRRIELAAAVVVALIAGFLVWSTRPPDVSGVWHLANGNVWAVTQEDDRLTIEETHRESREVWRKGVATLRGKVLDVELDLVFQRDYHYTGELQVAGNGATLTGAITLQRDGRKEPMTLTRQARQ
ncbi:MAG: toll/interleukin-1 receptor domain-containing protein [Burkholderiales bacterium]|nr:toll/interleukin-1 receptor domain-containing protein [Burkholderiales bacterium]